MAIISFGLCLFFVIPLHRAGMDFAYGGEDPAILQLQKWGSSRVQVNLSDFCEGFISPRRELLLLLSYHCEALLLPLGKCEYI